MPAACTHVLIIHNYSSSIYKEGPATVFFTINNFTSWDGSACATGDANGLNVKIR